MDYNNLSKKDWKNLLLALINKIEKEDSATYYSNNFILPPSRQNELETLIGTIPFLLTNKKIFEKNQDIAEFAKKLNIDIPSPEKKKREDIIGRIVVSIANFDNIKVAELNYAIKALKKTNINSNKSNFFRDWENVIKNIKI